MSSPVRPPSEPSSTRFSSGMISLRAIFSRIVAAWSWRKACVISGRLRSAACAAACASTGADDRMRRSAGISSLSGASSNSGSLVSARRRSWALRTAASGADEIAAARGERALGAEELRLARIDLLARAHLIGDAPGFLDELRLLQIGHARGVERPVGARDFEQVRFALPDEFPHRDLRIDASRPA